MRFAQLAPIFDAPPPAALDRLTAPFPLARLATILFTLVLGGYILVVALAGWLQPQMNWDAIAYSASVVAPGKGEAEVHREAYATIRAEASPGEYRALTEDDPYRVRQAADPRAFASMLPFYDTKVLYVATARALATVLGTYDALLALTVGSVLAIGAVCIAWLASAGALRAAVVVAVLLAVSDFGTIASGIVPDLFAAIFVLLTGWAMVARRDWLVVAVMTLAVLARPDQVAFAGVLMVAGIAAGLRVAPYVIMFACAFAAYAFASNVGDHPGWWVQFHFTNVAYAETIEGFDPAFTIATYFKAVAVVSARALAHEPWPFVMLALFAAAAWLHLRGYLARRETALALAIALTCAAKYAIFPLHETRFHIAQIILLGIMLAAAWGRGGTADRTTA